MKRGNRHLRMLKQFVDDETPLSSSTLCQLTTLVVDTPCLISSRYRYAGAWSSDNTEGDIVSMAAHALVGANTPTPRAVNACLPPLTSISHTPIATVDHTLTWASWHHGGDYETFWFGDVTTLLHHADITDTEREQLALRARKAIADGQLAYAVGSSLTSHLPQTPQLVIHHVGLIFVTPSIHTGISSAIQDIKKRNIRIIYASHDDAYTVTAIAQLTGIAAKNETAISITTARLRSIHNLYANIAQTAMRQLFASLPPESTISVTGSLVDFWHTASTFIDD